MKIKSYLPFLMLILLGAIQGEASASAIDDEVAAARKAYEQAEAEAAKAEEKAKLTAAEAAAATKAVNTAADKGGNATKASSNKIVPSSDSASPGLVTYSIYLTSHYSEAEAVSEQGRLAKRDIQTTIVPVTVKHHMWYRLLVSEHHNKTEALARLKAIKSIAGAKSAWLDAKKN